MQNSENNQNWNDLKLFLPKGWTSKAKNTNAFTRKRGFKSVPVLLRTLLIHLLNGCSLKETVARAEQGGICKVSHVALSKRLKNSREWFNWMSLQLTKYSGLPLKAPTWTQDYTVKTLDASVISEPGSTGTDYRLHYSMTLFNLSADQFHLTTPKVGETFKNFTIKPCELWIGDRAYCAFSQLKYVVDHGADLIVRFKLKGLTLLENGDEFDLLGNLKKLKAREIGDWKVVGIASGQKGISLRVCAIRKSEQKAREAIEDYKKQARKRGKKYSSYTLELQQYIIILTTLPENISAEKIMELYRTRWQIEVSFKRMKSLLGLGQLPKKDQETCLAWLEGKMFVAILIQTLLNEGNFFSPWGYPIKRI